MKIFKKLSLTASAILLAFFIGASLNSANANSQTNKLPRCMRNMWYGNESEDGLSRVKLYGHPYVDNGYDDLPITHIRRYGYRYDLHVPNADPIEVWYSHGHLNGLESGTAYIHLYAHHTHRHINKVSHFKRTNNKRLLKRSGFSSDYPIIISNYSPYSNRAYIPKRYKITKNTEWIPNSPNIAYDYTGHGHWKYINYDKLAGILD